jgi:catechol 2,3-dioxygenase-like lactoylglutathione lyase family enzyme
MSGKRRFSKEPGKTWIGSIVVDVSDFPGMMRFWREAIQYTPRDRPRTDGVILHDPAGRGPNLSLNSTPERPLDDYRIHLDLYSSDPEREVERLHQLGAAVKLPAEKGREFVTLADPDGNPFDVVDKKTWTRAQRTVRIGSIVVDSSDLPEMIAFWRDALGYVPKHPPQVYGVVLEDPHHNGPDFELKLTLENPLDDYRIHLDLYTSDRDGEVARLRQLGATLKRPAGTGHDFVTLADPDGNLFDVIDKKGWTHGQRA